MWRGPGSCEHDSYDSYDPDESDDAYEPDESHDSYQFHDSYEPDDSYQLCAAYELDDPDELYDHNESHQPGGPGQCTVTASCMRWFTWAIHLALGFVNIWSRGGS